MTISILAIFDSTESSFHSWGQSDDSISILGIGCHY